MLLCYAGTLNQARHAGLWLSKVSCDSLGPVNAVLEAAVGAGVVIARKIELLGRGSLSDDVAIVVHMKSSSSRPSS